MCGQLAGARALVASSRAKYYFSSDSSARQDENRDAHTSRTKVRASLGRDGSSLGHQPHDGPGPCAAIHRAGPLDAEEISSLLDVSRSNVSTSLRELITWGVVRRVHIIGDRRDRFEALKDVMETFRVIMAERKRREMDPTIALLEHCVHEAKLSATDEEYTREQLEKMLDFTRMVTTWYGHIDNLSTPALLRLFRGGSMLAKVFGKRQRATVTSDQEKAGAGSLP